MDLLERLFPTVAQIDGKTAVSRHAAGEVVMLDVRKPHEIKRGGAVPGAVQVPLEFVRHAANPKSPHYSPKLTREAPVVVFCQLGDISTRASRMLMKMGFTDVMELGVFRNWLEAGGPVER